jgi:hypothetical protein
VAAFLAVFSSCFSAPDFFFEDDFFEDAFLESEPFLATCDPFGRVRLIAVNLVEADARLPRQKTKPVGNGSDGSST